MKKAIEYATVAGIGYLLMTSMVRDGEDGKKEYKLEWKKGALYAGLAFAYLWWREY